MPQNYRLHLTLTFGKPPTHGHLRDHFACFALQNYRAESTSDNAATHRLFFKTSQCTRTMRSHS